MLQNTKKILRIAYLITKLLNFENSLCILTDCCCKSNHVYMHSCTLSLKYLFEKCLILSITIHIYKNTSLLLYLLVNMAEQKELTEFERGVIVGGWLFGHSEREIEEKPAIKRQPFIVLLKNIVKLVQHVLFRAVEDHQS